MCPFPICSVFGAKPLEDVLKNIRSVIVQDLEIALAQQAPITQNDDPSLFELPPLVIDGIPTPVDKMAQQQLRMFIPHMLKYSTGRGKPGEIDIFFEWTSSSNCNFILIARKVALAYWHTDIGILLSLGWSK